MRGSRIVCSLALLCVACAGDPTSDDLRNGSAQGGSAASSSPGAGTIAAGSGGTSEFGNGPGWRDAGPMQTDATVPGSADAGCGATSLAAEQVVVEEVTTIETEVTEIKPVALYLMLDQSLSMLISNLWDPAVAAITGFVNDPASAGIDVAINYFPGAGSCADGSGYSTPEVGVGRLPGHAAMITGSLAGHMPIGLGTPIEGALRGVTEFCKSFEATTPDEQCVAVLVTDGVPELSPDCSEDHAALAGIAGAAFSAGVTTFAVGLQGADFALLDQIAMQGGAPDCDPNGTGYACDVSAGASGLAATLASIRDTVTTVETTTQIMTHTEQVPLACEWQIPAPPVGQVFDRDKVNIKLTGTATDLTLGKVDAPDACARSGWHYDDAEAPTRLIACPETCEMIEATPMAKVDILLGCLTRPLE